jgi:hypothetical protein
MNQRNHVLSSTVNVITRVHHLNSALNHQTSKRIAFHHKSDPLEFHHKEELPSMKTLIMEARKLPTHKINHAFKALMYYLLLILVRIASNEWTR